MSFAIKNAKTQKLRSFGVKIVKEFVRKKIIATQQIKPIIKENAKTKQSGIYIFERVDECGIAYFYVGQAVNIFNRIVSHWNGYQRIDISMRKRGFYSKDNLYGWQFKILTFCDKKQLDEKEQYYITKNLKSGKQSYNLTYGSQGKGKIVMRETVQKGYQQGLSNGYENARKDIQKWFKYLKAEPLKDGKLNERMLIKFNDFLKGEKK